MANDFLSADVISEEVQGRSSQIPNASTSAFAIAGYSPRGPEGKAYVNTSFQEFVQRFGGFSTKSKNAYAAAAYFQNGGNRLIFVRELHSDAVAAEGTLENHNPKASGRGKWADGAQVVISGNQNYFNAETGVYSAFDVKILVIDANSSLLAVSESYEALVLDDAEDPDYIINVLNDQSEDVVYGSVSGGVVGIPSALQPVSHAGVAIATGVSGQSAYTGSVSGAGLPVLAGSFKLKVAGVEKATDDGLGNLSGTGVSGTVDYDSGAVAVSIAGVTGTPAITADYIEAPDASVTITLSGGSDGGIMIASDLVNAGLKATKRGIYALDDVTEQFTMDLPDFAGDATTAQALLSYAGGREDVFVPLCPPKGSTPQQAATFKRNTLKSVSSYGGMFYPWVKVPDPLNKNRPIVIPPSGHVAGRFAFTDLRANVGKAPAGSFRGQLQFLSGLERTLSKTERDIVYQAQINPIRSDSDVGTAIWGNKTLAINGDFTDINVRRLFIFLRKTQETGLLDIVFEDVGDTTFGLIKTRLETFLEGLWLNNVIGSGVKDKSKAFKVVCDASNNPESVQVTKRIVIDEYIKPNLAAEVIHLRLQRVFDASQF